MHNAHCCKQMQNCCWQPLQFRSFKAHTHCILLYKLKITHTRFWHLDAKTSSVSTGTNSIGKLNGSTKCTFYNMCVREASRFICTQIFQPMLLLMYQVYLCSVITNICNIMCIQMCDMCEVCTHSWWNSSCHKICVLYLLPFGMKTMPAKFILHRRNGNEAGGIWNNCQKWKCSRTCMRTVKIFEGTIFGNR